MLQKDGERLHSRTLSSLCHFTLSRTIQVKIFPVIPATPITSAKQSLRKNQDGLWFWVLFPVTLPPPTPLPLSPPPPSSPHASYSSRLLLLFHPLFLFSPPHACSSSSFSFSSFPSFTLLSSRLLFLTPSSPSPSTLPSLSSSRLLLFLFLFLLLLFLLSLCLPPLLTPPIPHSFFSCSSFSSSSSSSFAIHSLMKKRNI